MTQYFLNAVIAASSWLLVGLGFALVYRTARFFHFAHGAIFTVGAYSTYVFNAWLHISLLIAIPAGILSSMLCGVVIEFLAYRPLRRRSAPPLVLLVASLGLYVLLQSLVSCVFGEDTKSIRSSVVAEGISILGARITPIQILTVSASLILVVAAPIFLNRTKLGRAMHALASDEELARISGIAVDTVFLWTFALASALAGASGILVALDVDMTPTMGMNALMMGVVAVIIGGMNSFFGMALGALLLGAAQHASVWAISSQWQDAIAFVTLIVFLLVRPQGLLGTQPKSMTV